jgi:hypothetical protein
MYDITDISGSSPLVSDQQQIYYLPLCLAAATGVITVCTSLGLSKDKREEEDDITASKHRALGTHFSSIHAYQDWTWREFPLCYEYWAK